MAVQQRQPDVAADERRLNVAAKEPQSVVAADDRKNIFPFFDLSGELRNNVYDHALVDIETRQHKLIVRAEDVPAVSLLLVNKRFKSEYEDRTRNKAKLKITDNRWVDAWDLKSAAETFTLPTITSSVTKLHVHLLDKPDHKRWIDRVLASLPQLQALTVVLVTSASLEDAWEHNVITPLDDLCGLRCLETLDVYASKEYLVKTRDVEIKKEHKALTFNVEKRCVEKFECKELEDQKVLCDEDALEVGGIP